MKLITGDRLDGRVRVYTSCHGREQMEGRKHKEIDNEVEVLLCFSKGAETRKKILRSLQYCPKNCHQIAKKLNLDWWTVQKHLRRLKRINLVKGLKIGRIEFYRMTYKCEVALRVIDIRNTHLSET